MGAWDCAKFGPPCSGDSRMKKVGGSMRGQGKGRRDNINIYLAFLFFIVLKIKLL